MVIMQERARPKLSAAPADEALLERIARDRDREAFQLLFDRYGKPAFNLALHLAGNRTLAEDAVQDAMLSVWSGAQRFDAARGQARPWIMRIVANHSIKAGLKTSRESMYSRRRSDEPVREQPEPDHDLQHAELLGALRDKLKGLAATDRQLVVLYYAGELSQDEIAAAMEMPQPTVSLRIRQALEQLRAGLTAAGFAAAAPLIQEGSLRDALCSGQECPAGLGQRVLSSARASVGRMHSVKAAPAASAGTLGLAAALCAALAAGAWWYATQTPAAPSPAQTPPAVKTASTAPAPTIAPKQEEPIDATWTFEKGRPTDLPVRLGAWQWQPARGGKPACMRTAERITEILLPQRLPAAPVLLSMTVRLADAKKQHFDWTSGVFAIRDAMAPDAVKYERQIALDAASASDAFRRRTLRFYIVDRFIVGSIDDKANLVLVYPHGHQGWQLGVDLAGWDVEEISIRTLHSDDVPARVRDPEREIVTKDFARKEVVGYPVEPKAPDAAPRP